jgi:hypothetical protein
VEAEAFTSAVFDALDQEEAILTDGWPALDSTRGKMIFLLGPRRSESTCVEGHPSLRGRVIFTNAAPGSPAAAFVEVKDPLQDPALIHNLVRKGYLVRTRTDTDTKEARSGDTTQCDDALASGAQILSTDYPFDEKSSWTGFHVSFPEGGIARCNPVLTPANCPALR